MLIKSKITVVAALQQYVAFYVVCSALLWHNNNPLMCALLTSFSSLSRGTSLHCSEHQIKN